METKIKSEQASRKSLLARARLLNCEGEVKAILEKYDKALSRCTNETERRHIAITGLAELHNFFYCRGPLVVNGQTILPGEPGLEIPNSKFRKL